MNWDSLKLTQKRLSEIGSILGGQCLSKILGNYARDYKYWNHGMPDLILWCKETNRVKFSEVKSENDRLSDVQIAWLNFFTENGIKAEACYINRDASEVEQPGADASVAKQIFTKELN